MGSRICLGNGAVTKLLDRSPLTSIFYVDPAVESVYYLYYCCGCPYIDQGDKGNLISRDLVDDSAWCLATKPLTAAGDARRLNCSTFCCLL